MKYNRQSGFTIIELMISTMIFSLILLILTTGVISFTRSYYRGITETSTQRIARVISDDISQSIQSTSSFYSPLASQGGWNGFCIGTTGYSYTLGSQLVSSSPDVNKNQSLYGLIKGNAAGGCSSYNGQTLRDALLPGLTSSPSTSEEMLAPSMRLSNLSIVTINQTAGIYSVAVNVVYGDNDLLTNPTSISPSCLSDSGSQFCAVSGLSTVVQKRIQQ